MKTKSRSNLRGAALAGLAVVPAMGLTGIASAQGENVSVSERERPGYDALGVRLGAFTLLPQIDLGVQSNDNIFATNTGEESDFAYTVDPSVRLESNWSSHALAVFANSQNRLYQDFDVQDTTTSSAGAEAKVDVARGFVLDGSVNYTLGEEALAQLPTVGLSEPVEYNRLAGSARAKWDMARTRLTAQVGSETYDYDDGAGIGGGPIDQDFRDRTVLTGQLRGDLAISPDTALFVAVGANKREYDAAPVFGGPNRDSDGYEVLVGANFDISRLVRGDIGVGYFSQSFDRGGEDLEEVAVKGELEWFATQLVTVTARAERGVGDAALGSASGTIVSQGGVKADYEFARNIIFGAGVDYLQEDFQGIDRTDTRWVSGAEVQYLVNRGVVVFGRAQTTTQSSDGTFTGREYDQNVFTVGLRLRR